MNPEIAKTLVEQRHGELAGGMAEGRRAARPSGRPGWVRRHLPGWHLSWSRTVLSPTTTGYQDRPGRSGSSVVIIISAHR